MKRLIEIAISIGVAILLVAVVLATPLAERVRAVGRATYAYLVWDVWNNGTVHWRTFTFTLPRGRYGWSVTDSQELVVFSRIPDDTSVITIRSGLMTDSVVTDVKQICANVKCESSLEEESQIRGVKVHEARYSIVGNENDVHAVLKAPEIRLVVNVIGPAYSSPQTLTVAKELIVQAINQRTSK